MPTRTTPRGPWSGGGGPGGLSLPPFSPAPPDILVLLAVVFATFSLQFFGFTRWLPDLLHLGTALFPFGLLWQVVTYPFAGYGPPSILILLELLILYWFSRDVFYSLGRKRFWQTLLTVTVLAGVAAAAIALVGLAVTGGVPSAFVLMQGQRTLMAFAIAAFATMNRNATILLFFVLPIQARWFLWIEVLIGFVAFLGTHDLAGFVGICVVVGGTYWVLTSGGLGRALREWRLRAEKSRLERQLARERKKRNLRVLKGGGGRRDDEPTDGPWVH